MRTVMSDPFLSLSYIQTEVSLGTSCPHPQLRLFLPSHLGTSKPLDENLSCFSQVLFPPFSVVPGIPSGNDQELSPTPTPTPPGNCCQPSLRRCLFSQFKDLGPTAKLWKRWREGEMTDGKRGDSEQTGRQLILPWESPCTPSEDGGAAISPRPPNTTLFLFLCKYGRGRGGTEGSGHSKKEPYEIQCISRTEARSWGGERGH